MEGEGRGFRQILLSVGRHRWRVDSECSVHDFISLRHKKGVETGDAAQRLYCIVIVTPVIERRENHKTRGGGHGTKLASE